MILEHTKIFEKLQLKNFEGDDYTTGYLLDYPYFKEYYQLIAVDLSKQ